MTTNPRARVRHDLTSLATSSRGPRRAGARSHQKAMRRAYTSPYGYHGPNSYRRWKEQRADPPPQVGDLAGTSEVAVCIVEGCDRTDHNARGLCRKHYRQWWLHGHEHIGLPFCPPLRTRPPAPSYSEIVSEMRAAYRAFVEEVGA